MFASFSLPAGEKGIALVNRTAGVPTVILDVHRFRQILFNSILLKPVTYEKLMETFVSACS